MFRFRNQYIQAFFDAFLALASTHMVILIFDAILHSNYQLLNIFHIQDLDAFWPGLAKGPINFGLSLIVGLAVFILVLVINKQRR